VESKKFQAEVLMTTGCSSTVIAEKAGTRVATAAVLRMQLISSSAGI